MTKAKMLKGTKVLYGASICTFLVGIASLANTIMAFQSIVTQYTAQGYPINEILKQLVPSQLLPGIFQSLGMYLGVAFVLFGLASINEKVRPLLVQDTEEMANISAEMAAEQTSDEVCDVVEESTEKAE